MEAQEKQEKVPSMSLQDITPQPSAWKVTTEDGQDLEFQLRKFTINDEAWIQHHYKGNSFQQMVERLDGAAIAKLGFHQMNLESQRQLMKIKFVEMDEDGNEVETAKKGPEKVQMLLSGVNDIIELLSCLLETRGLSLPKLMEMEKSGTLTRLLDLMNESQKHQKSIPTG